MNVFKKHFRVNGTTFYEIDESGISTELGTVSGTDTVSFANSFNTQAIVADGRYYLYDPTNGFREVTDSDLGNPIDVVWVDGYYFFTDGEFIYHTDINDESAIDPLKFATAEFMPDDTLGVTKTQDNKVAVFGRYTVEYFTNTAQDNFAFQRIQQRAIKIGIVGTHCKCEVESSFFILGGRKEQSVGCWAVAVGGTQKVSTREVDKVIGAYTEIELADSVVETYSEDGYQYVVYHLPNETLLFNYTLSRSVGIEQSWTILQTGDDKNYRGIHYVNDIRIHKWILGDKTNGNLGILTETLATQYDELCTWELYSPWYYLEGASVDMLEVEILPGFNDQGDATVFLSLTYDGVNYSKNYIEIYGSQSNYNQRYILRRLWLYQGLGGL